MFLCWSAKGGSGTTVVAASLALVLSRSHPTVLVDLAGDVPAALGMPEPSGPGVHDWLASSTGTPGALDSLAVPAAEGLHVVPHGTRHDPADLPDRPDRWAALAAALVAPPVAGADTAVVVDAGHHTPPAALLAAAEHRLLVTRACYLALRRASTGTARPTGIVLVQEVGRSLSARDLEHALGAPIVAEVPWDPAVHRCVDAGLLATRLPLTLTRALRHAA